MNSWFTSDTHFGHAKVIEYCKRPFLDAAAMDAEMVQRWNAVVHPEDTVYHLGDFAFATKERHTQLRKLLNGRIVIIKGNHDRSRTSLLECGFDEVHNELLLTLEETKVYLRHIPRFDFSDADLHLCGHVHGDWPQQGNVVNVGVDVRDFRPVSLSSLRSP